MGYDLPLVLNLANIMTKEKILDGRHWLVIAKYPCAQTAEEYEIVESDIDPLEYNDDLYEEMAESCFQSYSYLDRFDEDEYDSEEEYNEAYDEFYEDIKSQIDVFAKLITPELLEEYGEKWYVFGINE